MRETITLKNPILVDGKEVKTLNYDMNEITSSLFNEASLRANAEVQKTKIPKVAVMETDASFHLELGKAGIIAVNPNIDFMDLERIKGLDVITLTGIGRNFITGGLVDNSNAEISSEQSEITVDSTTQE